jgi:hypothetical protein
MLYVRDVIAVKRLRTGDVIVSRHVGRKHKRCDCAWKHRALVGPRSLLTYLRDLQSAFDYVRSSEIVFAKCDHTVTLRMFQESIWVCAGTFLSLVFRHILRIAKNYC